MYFLLPGSYHLLPKVNVGKLNSTEKSNILVVTVLFCLCFRVKERQMTISCSEYLNLFSML